MSSDNHTIDKMRSLNTASETGEPIETAGLKNDISNKADDFQNTNSEHVPTLQEILSADKKLIISGLLWFAGGTAITIYTYEQAASNPYGGSYFVMWGAIGWGLWDFLRGLGGYFWHQSKYTDSKLAALSNSSNNKVRLQDEKSCIYCKHAVPVNSSVCPNCNSDVS